MLRHFSNAVIAAVCALAFLFMLRLTLSPDPAQSLFFRAQQLEAAGQIPLSLRAYALISNKHPESFYAPRALLRQGDLLAAQGLRSDDKGSFRGAVAAYLRLAATYPSDALVTEALLDAGKISAENLGDLAGAKKSYVWLLEKSGAKSDQAAIATLKLGRIALDEGDKNTAQTLLQRVLQRWPQLENRAAEAQFFLGVTYDTLFKKTEWATRAYDATIARYPNSTWANEARQKLGLIVFSTRPQRPARRVLINIDALPDNGNSDGSLWSALRVVLAAHGVEASEAALGGWSLTPFYAGLDPKNPGRVVKAPFDAWENVLANAGLRFSIQQGGKEDKALRFLQDEIDAARAPLVYFEENGAKTWALCIGYDSERGEVMLQRRGARFDTLSAKSFAAMWSAKSSFGEPFTLISLVPADQKTPPAPNLTPTPAPRPAPGAPTTQLAAPNLQNAPTFVWQLTKISLQSTDKRTRQRGATILKRGRDGQLLLGAPALNFLARELSRIARAPAEIPLETTQDPQEIPTEIPIPIETAPPANEGADESPYAPEATPTPFPTSTPAPRRVARFPQTAVRHDGARARFLLQFLGDPARHWAASRRDAAAWCDEAANRGKSPKLKRVAQAFRKSALALETAISLAPSAVSDAPGAGDRNQIGEVARQIEIARQAELEAQRGLAG